MKRENGEIRIQISKWKAFLLTLIALGLLSISIWAFTKSIILPSGFDKTFLLIGISILIIAFGFSSFSGLKKLSNKKQGLIINNSGIKINIGPNQGQFIEWKDIKEIKIHNQIQGPLFLLFFIRNPQDILEKSSGLKKILLKMNNISHKTPVSITSTWLDCNFYELTEIIEQKMIDNSAQHRL